MAGADEALAALARDLVEEIAAGRALELAAPRQAPFARQQKPDPEVPGTGDQENDQARWLKGQQQWKAKGDGIWAGRYADLDPRSADQFTKKVEAAHAQLSDPEKPALAKGYEQLHEAHRIATEQLLPRAETDQQKQSVRDGITHVRDRMRDIDKASGIKSTRTRRLTGSVPERAERAREKLDQGEQYPMVTPELPKMPPPPKGAAAVHPALMYLPRLPGDTLSGHAHAHVPQPLPQETATPEGTALEAANRRLDQYAKREQAQRDGDLRDHLAELRHAESEMRAAKATARGQAAPGEYRPLDDEQYGTRAQDAAEKVQAALAKGRATVDQHSPDGGYSWNPERALAHDEILRDYLGKQVNVPSDKKAVLLSGGMTGKQAGAGPRDYAQVSTGLFTRELAQRGLVPEVEGLSPLEASPLAHAEAAHLAHHAARQLAARGKNIAFDTGHAGPSLTHVQQLHDQGYTVRGAHADTPPDKLAARARSAHRQGLEGYRQGTSELGAAHVTPDLLRSAEAEPGVSRARQAFDAARPHLDGHQRLDDHGKVVEQSTAAPDQGIPSVEALRRLRSTQ